MEPVLVEQPSEKEIVIEDLSRPYDVLGRTISTPEEFKTHAKKNFAFVDEPTMGYWEYVGKDLSVRDFNCSPNSP